MKATLVSNVVRPLPFVCASIDGSLCVTSRAYSLRGRSIGPKFTVHPSFQIGFSSHILSLAYYRWIHWPADLCVDTALVTGSNDLLLRIWRQVPAPLWKIPRNSFRGVHVGRSRLLKILPHVW